MPARGQQPRRAVRVAGLTGAGLALAAAAALAAASPAIVVSDKTGDVTGPLDIQRAALNLAADGRLRAVVTFAAKVAPKALVVKSGPPGSVCVRLWTVAGADPTATRPDHLVCVTADKDAKLRAGVFTQPDAGLPQRAGTASVTANSSGRSFVIRMSQSSLGRPAAVRFAVESTRPGCDRTSCIDTAPDGGVTKRFRLR